MEKLEVKTPLEWATEFFCRDCEPSPAKVRQVEALVAAVMKSERNNCARVCDFLAEQAPDDFETGAFATAAAAIRAGARA